MTEDLGGGWRLVARGVGAQSGSLDGRRTSDIHSRCVFRTLSLLRLVLFLRWPSAMTPYSPLRVCRARRSSLCVLLLMFAPLCAAVLHSAARS